MRFRGTVKLAGKTATGIQVPPEVVADLGSGKRPPVTVTINGHTYRTSVAPMGGAFMLPVSAEQRAAAGVAAGDEVDIDIEVDTQPREVSVPQDLGDALDGDPQARTFFDGLSYSNRLRHVLSIEGAKTAETRQRRIRTVVEQMHEGLAVTTYPATWTLVLADGHECAGVNSGLGSAEPPSRCRPGR